MSQIEYIAVYQCCHEVTYMSQVFWDEHCVSLCGKILYVCKLLYKMTCILKLI